MLRHTAPGARCLIDCAAVLHGIVHERGHDGLGVELPVGTQARHRDRVGDVGLAVLARLPGMGRGGDTTAIIKVRSGP